MVSRRHFVMGTAVAAASAGLARWPFSQQEDGNPWALLEKSLSDRQRNQIILPVDHPSRQVINTLPIIRRPHMGVLLDADQRALAHAGYRNSVSAAGHERFERPFNTDAGGISGSVLVMYGQSGEPGFQAYVSGGHFGFRGHGTETAAFGGPVSYGDQAGNREFKIPGNAWAYQSDLANALYEQLNEAQRKTAIVPEPPNELLMHVQGEEGSFTGLPLNQLSDVQRPAANNLLDGLLRAYPEGEQQQARQHIEANGGIDTLHMSYFANKGFFADKTTIADRLDEQTDEMPYFQVWRVEGPGMVAHFKGHPHVHAYLHIVRHPDDQHIGEVLGEVPYVVEEDDLKEWIEDTLAEAVEADVSVFPGEVPGRFSRGKVTSGDIWTLDPYSNEVLLTEIRGDKLSDDLKDVLERRDIPFDPDRRYQVAGLDFHVTHFEEHYGNILSQENTGTTMRETLTAYVKKHGLHI